MADRSANQFNGQLLESQKDMDYAVNEDQNMTQESQEIEYSDYHQAEGCEESLEYNTSETSSPSVLHSWTPTQEEKQQLKTHGQAWKQGIWSTDETEQLKQNILEYCQNFSIKDPCEIIFESGKEKRKNFYKTIAKGINRPLFAIYRRVVRMYDSKNHVGKYSEEELKKLQELRKQFGNDWQKIGLAMGRSAASIKDRCRHLKEDCNAGPWTLEEEDLLADAVFSVTQSLPGEKSIAGIPWTQIAQRVGSRSERQCRKKWLSYHTTRRVGTIDWNEEDELYLLQRLTENQVENDKQIGWTDLAQTWPRPSVRSHQWLRAKWRRMRSEVKDCDNLCLQETCNRLMIQRNSIGSAQVVNVADPEGSFNPNSRRPGSILSLIGIIPGTSINASNGMNFSIGLGQTSVILTPPCVTNIPMYLCTTNSVQDCSASLLGSDGRDAMFVESTVEDTRRESVAVIHLDLDGGEEPAVTTDVMFSGSSLCSHGSPLGLVEKCDHESEHSQASK